MKHVTEKHITNCSMFHVPRFMLHTPCSMLHASCSMKSGYTLIEVSVAVAIFFIVLAVPSGYLVGSLKSQIKTLASQELLDQTSYTLEYMSRALRMAKKELNCTDPNDPATCSPSNPPFCLTNTGYGYNYEKTTHDGKEGIKFINYNNKCQEFYLDGTKLKEEKEGSVLPLTSDKLKIVLFKISGEESWDQNDPEQPRVTIFLDIKGGSNFKEELQPEIKIQTTISQRNLDIPQ